jgi:hypothetical protein
MKNAQNNNIVKFEVGKYLGPNPPNQHQINSPARGFFRPFLVKLCKYANLRI